MKGRKFHKVAIADEQHRRDVCHTDIRSGGHLLRKERLKRHLMAPSPNKSNLPYGKWTIQPTPAAMAKHC